MCELSNVVYDFDFEKKKGYNSRSLSAIFFLGWQREKADSYTYFCSSSSCLGKFMLLELFWCLNLLGFVGKSQIYKKTTASSFSHEFIFDEFPHV